MIMSVIQSFIVRVARYVVFPHTNLLDNTIIHNYFRTLEGGGKPFRETVFLNTTQSAVESQS